MEPTTQSWLSPQTASGSVLSSVAVHAFLAGMVVVVLGAGFFKQALTPQGEVDLGYQVFDAPPPPEKVVHHVMRSAEPQAPTDTKVKPDNTPKELQDAKGDVAGTQKAAKVEQNLGNQQNGDAQATPYYKIKPKYPHAALVDGVEGWVLMKIDVKETGEVENVRVIGGEKRNMFEAEARRAVEKWKYRPFLDTSGKPFKKVDHEVRVDFKLAEASS